MTRKLSNKLCRSHLASEIKCRCPCSRMPSILLHPCGCTGTTPILQQYDVSFVCLQYFNIHDLYSSTMIHQHRISTSMRMSMCLMGASWILVLILSPILPLCTTHHGSEVKLSAWKAPCAGPCRARNFLTHVL